MGLVAARADHPFSRVAVIPNLGIALIQNEPSARAVVVTESGRSVSARSGAVAESRAAVCSRGSVQDLVDLSVRKPLRIPSAERSQRLPVCVSVRVFSDPSAGLLMMLVGWILRPLSPGRRARPASCR